ncbi:type II toxin-antitoxin system VapC family toxin [Wenzhouxiangella sp. AB-CW3]|uniref:type II toxin-antitoxin system VapC family toxin n=1 Tax=Wenzhouxiangella sp. AB-CW3 TaxID=2771012 RepID=UPI00168AB248|nr:type II toxin-antitoxin system VapC family toxin [Wenzhouxiangella sp. AB-CW3]QOC22771.1 type II toxin-antitoxin system VapC family toxin [Wenzhouxiangella sp. AB-CW3]
MLVLDTNVISELMRPAPDRSVVAWVGEQPGGSLFTTTVTEAELRYGLALLSAGTRRKRLIDAFDRMMAEDFARRVLPFDRDAARAYADIVASRRLSGRPIAQFDAQTAAIACSRDAGVVTRNERDFSNCVIEVINPWSLNPEPCIPTHERSGAGGFNVVRRGCNPDLQPRKPEPGNRNL